MKKTSTIVLFSVCLAILGLSSIVLSVYLCLIYAWGWTWLEQIDSLFSFSEIHLNQSEIYELLFVFTVVIFNVVAYQLLLRKGSKCFKKPPVFIFICTTVSALIVFALPLIKVFNNPRALEIDATEEFIFVVLFVILLNYLDGIIYAIRHYPRLKKEKVKTE